MLSLGTGLAAELLGLPWVTLSIVPLSLPSVDLAALGGAPAAVHLIKNLISSGEPVLREASP